MKRIKPSQLGPVLKGLAEMTGDDFKEVLQKLTFDAYRSLVRRSATDTGYLRSKWQISVDSKPSDSPHTGNPNTKYPAPDTPRVTIEAGSIVVLYNNTEYAIHLEQGTPRMRAQPMVEPTRWEIEAIAIKLSKLLSKKRYDV